MALGVLEQLGAVTLRGVEIAGPERDWAGGLSEHAAERQRVAVGAAFLDVSGGEGLSLIGQTLKPQDASSKILRRYSQIEREDFRLLRRHMQGCIDPVDAQPSLVLIPEIMQRDGHQPVAQHDIGLVGRVLSCVRKAIGERTGLAELSVVELVDAQAPERALRVVLVAEPLRELQCRRPCRASLADAADPVHQ